MRIGIFVGTVGSAPDLEGQVRQVIEAEEDGFDSFWLAQILGVDALTLIAVAGQRTSRIELGTAVMPTFARHPLAMAQAALSAQAASRGRLTLGMGVAHKPTVEDRLGLRFERPAQHMLDYLTIVRALVENRSVEYDGEVFRVSATLALADAEPFPILIAALAPRMLKIAGEMADGTVTWMTGAKTLAEHIVPRLDKAAEAASRPKPRVCVGAPIAVTDDAKAARDRAAEIFQRYGQLPSYRRMLDMEDARAPEDIVVVGSEDEVEDQLRRIADAGATDLLAAMFPVGGDEEASVARTRALLKSLVGKI